MNLRRRYLAPLAALVALAGPILLAQTPAPAPELTLEECIQRALSRNFDIEAQRYSPQVAKDSIEVAKSGYLPVFSLTSNKAKSHSTTYGYDTHSSDTTLSVSQEFYSGTTVTVSNELARSKIDYPTSSLNPAYNADVTVSVRQQLLKGLGTEVNRAATKRAEFGYNAAELTYKAKVLDVILSTEEAYYSLVYAQEQLSVYQASLALAQRLYDEAVTRKNTGVATDLDVLTAQVSVETARRQVLLGQQSLKNAQDSLLAIIGRFEFDTALGTARFKEVSEALPVFASSYAEALRNQPDYLAAQAQLEQAKLDVVTTKDATKPDLSVGGAVGFNGHRGSGSDALNDAYRTNNDSWQVDLSLSYPWGQASAKAKYRQSRATLNQQTLTLKQTEQSIQVKVRSAIRAVETNQESVKISTSATALAVKQYDLQKAKFDAGLATSREVQQAQTDLETARLSELQAKVNLRTSIASLHRLEGSSLQRYGLALP